MQQLCPNAVRPCIVPGRMAHLAHIHAALPIRDLLANGGVLVAL
jgi:hypothetical protein